MIFIFARRDAMHVETQCMLRRNALRLYQKQNHFLRSARNAKNTTAITTNITIRSEFGSVGAVPCPYECIPDK